MPKRALLWTVLLAAVVGPSCSEEAPVLRRFFTAVQAGDIRTVSTISAATYPWVIESWEILGRVSDTTEAFKLSAIKLELEEKQKEREALVKEYTRFRLDNLKAVRGIEARLEAEPDCTFGAKLAAVHEELVRYHEQLRQLERGRRALAEALRHERTLARMSLMGSISEIDGFEGNVSIKKVRVALSNEDGVTKNYLVTVCRYDLTNPENKSHPRSRWIVAELEEEA